MNSPLDPVVHPECDADARANYVLLAHALSRMAEAIAPLDAQVMVVKGAALAMTVYPKPWQRAMSDIDVLVRESDLVTVLAALAEGGFQVLPAPQGRTFSAPYLGETAALLPLGKTTLLVEVHHRLDKVLRRPIDYEGVFARALSLPGTPLLRVPCTTDHALLVILHAASSDFRHEVAWEDLELLFSAGVDFDELVDRAHAWGLETATYVAAANLRALGSNCVPEVLLERLAPGWWRQRALDISHSVSRERPRRTGASWIFAQAPLHDDVCTWLRALASYGTARARDRLW